MASSLVFWWRENFHDRLSISRRWPMKRKKTCSLRKSTTYPTMPSKASLRSVCVRISSSSQLALVPARNTYSIIPWSRMPAWHLRSGLYDQMFDWSDSPDVSRRRDYMIGDFTCSIRSHPRGARGDFIRDSRALQPIEKTNKMRLCASQLIGTAYACSHGAMIRMDV
ncbi:MAG: hypothetical protein M2R45_01750 [Verrucomicrobia subdivision 3 bacterium]|nr:hypothetical protein [Limisphaerales bacterium]MCS1413487.1 hypothetical protein [Limisphaerales bacterium]